MADSRIKYFPCTFCGKLFHVKRCNYESGRKTTCSRECSKAKKFSNNPTVGKEEAILKLHAEGKIKAEIAKTIGIDPKSLDYWYIRQGLTPNYRDFTLTPEETKAIQDLIDSGMAASRVAKVLNISRRRVEAYAKKNNYISPKFLTQDKISERINPGMIFLGHIVGYGYKVQCKKHPEIRYIRNGSDLGGGCHKCTLKGTSKGEQEVFSWIKSLGLEAINRYKYDKRKEVDIFIPSKNLAIEYNGIYWHSTAFNKEKNKHYNKMKDIESLGMRLITIFEDEWVNREAQVKGFLMAQLGLGKKIMARDCEIREVDASSFLSAYHIQGAPKNTLYSVGIYKDELLGVMTLGRHHRGEGLVLTRLCFKEGIAIVGGSSRLLSRAKIWAKAHGYSKIITWSDNRWSSGKVYSSIGMRLDTNLKPDYSYVNHIKRYSKQSQKKRPGEIGTEEELRLAQGLYKLWDCGKKRWVCEL